MLTIKDKILDTISTIYLNNGKKLSEIITDIATKNNNIGIIINIDSLSLDEANNLKHIIVSKIYDKLNLSAQVILTKDIGQNNHKLGNKPKHLIDGVKQIILVSSCKGGVGKSTISTIIAEQLANLNYSTGLLDADIYGPSIPTMFNITSKPKIENNKIIPIVKRNIQINSIGFLTDLDTVLAWRGPMVSKAIYKLLSLTDWQNLDYLIIDMPPGTGDITLAILENYQIDGAIIVTTPQKISQVDVAKTITLYNKFNVPIFSIIQNMSYLDNENNIIFSGNSGEVLSKEFSIPLIKIPLLPELTKKCDAGESLMDIVQKINLTKIIF